MAKVEKIDKWLDTGDKKSQLNSKKKSASTPRNKSKSGNTSAGKGRSYRSNSDITNRIQLLLKESPDSPIFFGKGKLTIKEPKRRFFKKRQYPDLTTLRVDLNALSEKGKPDVHNRQKVRNDLKNYPNVPDLYVINAIYTYQDIPRQNAKGIVSSLSQDKLNENQLIQLKKAINEIVLAFHNGGLNIFNVNWFMKIYIEYLNIYKGRLTYEYSTLEGRQTKELTTLAEKLKGKQAEIINLLSIKDKLGGIARLSRRLNGTTYLSEGFTPLEIRKAVQAVKDGDPTKTISQDRTASKLVFILITLLFLLAKVPILKNLVEDILKKIPDDDRGMLLRKRMVLTIVLTNEFEVALAGSNKDKARETADQAYAYCLNTINQYTKDGLLKEQFEIDPYLKAAWVVKAASGLFAEKKYKEMLKQAYSMMETISGEKNHLREPHREAIVELSKKYVYQIDTIMEIHGWLGEAESSSWQNRA